MTKLKLAKKILICTNNNVCYRGVTKGYDLTKLKRGKFVLIVFI